MIALVDANSFFCSCEQLFNPKLWGKEMVTLSDGKSGCVISATRQAKSLGINIGDPYFKVKDLCRWNHIYHSKVNFQRCSDMSSRLMCFLDQLGFEVERYSVDEAFIHLPNFKRDWSLWAREVSHQCFRMIGIPVSIGIGKTKTLAKIASSCAKSKDGVFVFKPQNFERTLRNFDVSKIWMIGRSSAHFLKSLGIKTAWGLISYSSPERLYRKGRRYKQVIEELKGIHHYESEHDSGKSLICSRTFDTPYYDEQALMKVWSLFLHQSCIRLRKKQRATRGVTFFARTSYFEPDAQGFRFNIYLDEPVNDARVMIKQAQEELSSLQFQELPYRKIGITFWDIYQNSQKQLSLFGDHCEKAIQGEKLLKTIDSIQQKFGDLSIHSASVSKTKLSSKRIRIEDLPCAV